MYNSLAVGLRVRTKPFSRLKPEAGRVSLIHNEGRKWGTVLNDYIFGSTVLSTWLGVNKIIFLWLKLERRYTHSAGNEAIEEIRCYPKFLLRRSVSTEY